MQLQEVLISSFKKKEVLPFNPSDSSAELQAKFNDAEAKAKYAEHVSYLDKVVDGRHTQWQLQCAFSLLLQEGQHWKEPIHATIDEADYDICNEACIYNTGGMLHITNESDDGAYDVYSEGYYHHIGA